MPVQYPYLRTIGRSGITRIAVNIEIFFHQMPVISILNNFFLSGSKKIKNTE